MQQGKLLPTALGIAMLLSVARPSPAAGGTEEGLAQALVEQLGTGAQHEAAIELLPPEAPPWYEPDPHGELEVFVQRIGQVIQERSQLEPIATRRVQEVLRAQVRSTGDSYRQGVLRLGDLTPARYLLFSSFRFTQSRASVTHELVSVERGTTVARAEADLGPVHPASVELAVALARWRLWRGSGPRRLTTAQISRSSAPSGDLSKAMEELAHGAATLVPAASLPARERCIDPAAPSLVERRHLRQAQVDGILTAERRGSEASPTLHFRLIDLHGKRAPREAEVPLPWAEVGDEPAPQAWPLPEANLFCTRPRKAYEHYDEVEAALLLGLRFGAQEASPTLTVSLDLPMGPFYWSNRLRIGRVEEGVGRELLSAATGDPADLRAATPCARQELHSLADRAGTSCADLVRLGSWRVDARTRFGSWLAQRRLRWGAHVHFGVEARLWPEREALDRAGVDLEFTQQILLWPGLGLRAQKTWALVQSPQWLTARLDLALQLSVGSPLRRYGTELDVDLAGPTGRPATRLRAQLPATLYLVPTRSGPGLLVGTRLSLDLETTRGRRIGAAGFDLEAGMVF